MAIEDVERLTLNTRLVDEASGPLLKLKQTTSQTMGSMATDASKASSAMNQSAGGIASAFSRAGGGIMGAARSLESGFSTIGRGIENVATNALKTAGIIGGALAAAGIAKATEVIQKGYERVITLQDATAQSAVLMGGDVQGAQKFIEGIRDVVTGTPFTLPDFAKAGTQLMMYGIQAEKIPGILTAVGDASAGNGARAREVANQMTRAFSKMAATGKVQLDDIWSMADAGVPAIKILANGFGVTTAAMQDMISYGSVPAEKAIQILTDGIENGTNGAAGATMAYAGSMEQLGKTWSGSVAIMEASKGRLGEAFLNPLKDSMPGINMAIKGIYDSFQVFVPLWTDWLNKSGVLTKIHDFLVKIGTKIKELGENDSAGLKALIDKFKEWMPLIAPILGGLSGIGSEFLGKLPFIGQFLPKFSPLLGIVLGLIAASPDLRNVFVGAWEKLQQIMDPLGGKFKDLGQKLWDAFGSITEDLANILTKVFDAILPLIPKVVEFGVAILEWAIPKLSDLVDWLSKNWDWLVLVAGAVLAGVAAFEAYKIIGGIVDLLKVWNDWNIIAAASQWLLNGALLAHPVVAVIVGIAALVGALVWFFTQTELGRDIIKNVWQAIQDFVGGVVTWFQTYVLPVIQAVFQGIGDVVNWLWVNIIQPTFTNIGNFINTVWTQWISPVFEMFKAGIEMLGAILGWFWRAIIEPTFSYIGQIISSWWNNTVMPIFDAVVSWVRDKIAPIFTWLHDTIIKPVFDGIASAIQIGIDAVGKLVSALVEKAQPPLLAIGGIFQGIAGFIGDVVDGIGSFLSSGIDKITDFFHDVTNFFNHLGSGGGIAQAMGGGLVIRHMAEGGILGGYSPGRDLVPALLSPGEAVLVPELVRAMGASNIMAANWAYSHGRPAMAGSPDRAGGSPSLGLGGGTQVTVIVSAGAIQISTTGGVDSGELRGALETVLADAARRAY